ncbi:unnamed protein product [Trichogramma brassicae]|uniref:RNA-directed DNA polymerase n=1 Tax=Trichogramma brassicae TaxID=86971 RepID=A0A6H5IYS1_9HYME|nr:unnamed protein product [Trichogramma brassicae]
MEYEFDKDPVDDSAIMSIWETNRNENCEIGVFIIIDDNQEILAFQFRDEEIEAKRKILNKPASQRSRDEKESVKDFEISSGVLYKRIGDKLRYVVPKCMRKSLAVRYHDYGGHQGVARTFELMSRRYYFAGMRRYIKQHVHSCFHCLASKTRPGRQLGELHPIPPGKRPFHTIHIDHVGPFVRSSRGNKFVFVLIDNLTKFVILVAMRDTKTANVVKSLEQFVCDFGAPVRIISDRGTCFTSSKNFGEFCNKHGIKHILTSPRHAQANGQVERVNAVLIPLMQSFIERKDTRDWDLKLRQVQRDLNEAQNATTGKSPFEALYGFTPSHDEGALRELSEIELSYDPSHTRRYREIAQEIEQKQERMKTRYDKNRVINVQFKVGDVVFFKVNPVATGDSTKLQYKNRGPLVVTEVLPGDTFRIAELGTHKNRYSTTAQSSQLKIWEPHADEHDEIIDDYEE